MGLIEANYVEQAKQDLEAAREAVNDDESSLLLLSSIARSNLVLCEQQVAIIELLQRATEVGTPTRKVAQRGQAPMPRTELYDNEFTGG